MADVEDGKVVKAKEFGRQASKAVVKVSRQVSEKGVGYTKSSIKSIASALPDQEIMLVAIMAVTIFIRSEEAHLRRKCYPSPMLFNGIGL